jgi:hypothetical protein
VSQQRGAAVRCVLLASLAATLICSFSLDLAASRSDRFQSFHIHGTILSYTKAVVGGAVVRFEGTDFRKFVHSDSRGLYQADLPVGSYTMTITDSRRQSLRDYQRPLFRVPSPTDVILDVTLDPSTPSCDQIFVPDSALHYPRDAEMGCAGSDLFSVPSREQVPFQLFIQFITKKSTDTGFAYNTDMRSPSRTPVFVAYNLFTLRAAQVFYDVEARSLKATGNVVMANETGSTRQADSMTFKIEDGEAMALP